MNDDWSLEDLYRSLAREWRVLLTIGFLCILAAVGAFFVWPINYSSSATMTVEPIVVNQSGATVGSVNMETERVVATSTEVLALAAEELPNSTVKQLRDSILVTIPKGAQVLEFTFTSENSERAAQSANAVATAYSERRVLTAQSVVDTTVESLTERIAELTTQLEALPEESPVRLTLTAQIQSLQERQVSFSSATFYPGSLVSPAVAPSASTKPSLTVFLAAGLFLGAFLGAFIALIVARAKRNRIRENTRQVAPLTNTLHDIDPTNPDVADPDGAVVDAARPGEEDGGVETETLRTSESEDGGRAGARTAQVGLRVTRKRQRRSSRPAS